jgi:ubiquinone/menaquinone biosynthesis C-methylase UbiE
MYLALAAASDGPILEIACGTGRISNRLAAAGHDVTGVDIDPGMLDRARRAWSEAPTQAREHGSLTLLDADATSLALNRRFDLVILGFNSLLVIGNGDVSGQQRVLRRMARHLTRDGRAVIDTWLPTPDDLALYDGRLIHEWTRHDPETGELVSKTTSATYEEESRKATIDTFFDAWHEGESPRRTSRRDIAHFPSRDELPAMIDSAGLAPQIIAGDYDMSPLEEDSERVIIVAAKGPSRALERI